MTTIQFFNKKDDGNCFMATKSEVNFAINSENRNIPYNVPSAKTINPRLKPWPPALDIKD